MSTPTVLVADDNQDSRTILGAVFRHCGYAVIETPDGESALRTLRERAVALVVSELYIPCGDASCLVEMLKRRPDTAAIPVLVVTSRVMPGDWQHARETGCDAILGKPFDLREIVRVADALLRIPRPSTPAALGPSRTAGTGPVGGPTKSGGCVRC